MDVWTAIFITISMLVGYVVGMLYVRRLIRESKQTEWTYTPIDPEPAGYDLNKKDWDAPEYEQPYSVEEGFREERMAKLRATNAVLTVNEVRRLKELEDSIRPDVDRLLGRGGTMILPSDWQVRNVWDLPHECQCPKCLETRMTDQYIEAYNGMRLYYEG